MMKNVNFKPFVGEYYGLSYPKILILGESHYNEGYSDDESDYTIAVIKSLGQRINGKRHRFFTTIAKVLTGKLDTYLDAPSAKAFWDTVAFYNYVQEFVGTRARQRPTVEMFQESKEAFLQVLEMIKPTIVIVVGVALKRHLDWLEVDFGDAKPCYWVHPASPKYFKKIEALEALSLARKKAKLQ